MSYVSKRIVKGKKYFYLEESFFFNNKLVKESVYFGSSYPSNNELFLGYEILKRTCLERNHFVLVPPLTKFISSRTARIIQESFETNKIIELKNNQNNLKKIFLKNKRKRINSFNDFGNILGLGFDSKKLTKLFNYYFKLLQNNEELSEKKIRVFYKILFGEEKIFSEEEFFSLQLFFSWFKKKRGLIHFIEYSSLFFGKFFSLNLFEEKKNIFMGLLLFNYAFTQNLFLNENEFIYSFLNKDNQEQFFPKLIVFSNKQFPYLKKALIASTNEDFKPLTKLFIKKIVKENKKELFLITLQKNKTKQTTKIIKKKEFSLINK